ncbi:hypothetical protein TELCIR_19439, partial [Teladorsagia circumcincta]
LIDERTQFEDERKKVYELNARLNELCRAQETIIGQDKYRVREEWNRLNAEKQAFMEDQKFVLQNIEKQAAAVENSKSTFFHEQHDLLTRMSAERQLFEQEKNEFHGMEDAKDCKQYLTSDESFPGSGVDRQGLSDPGEYEKNREYVLDKPASAPDPGFVPSYDEQEFSH